MNVCERERESANVNNPKQIMRERMKNEFPGLNLFPYSILPTA